MNGYTQLWFNYNHLPITQSALNSIVPSPSDEETRAHQTLIQKTYDSVIFEVQNSKSGCIKKNDVPGLFSDKEFRNEIIARLRHDGYYVSAWHPYGYEYEDCLYIRKVKYSKETTDPTTWTLYQNILDHLQLTTNKPFCNYFGVKLEQLSPKEHLKTDRIKTLIDLLIENGFSAWTSESYQRNKTEC